MPTPDGNGNETERHRLPSGWARLALAWAGLLAYGIFGSLSGSEITTDEAWFLHITLRALDGETPYRDFFLGATPLSLYLTMASASLLGHQLLAVRVVMAAIAVGTYWLTWRIAAHLGLARPMQVLAVLAVLAYAPARLPGYGAPYTPMAFMFLMATLERFLVWSETWRVRSNRGPLLAAAVFAGLSFVSKQNVGLLAVAALGAGALLVLWPERRRVTLLALAFTVAGGFALGALPPLIPVAVSGGLPGLADFGFLGKGVYLSQGAYGYDTALSGLLTLAQQPITLFNVRGAYWQLQLLFVWPALAALSLVAWRRPTERDLALVLGMFLAAGLAGAYPLFSLPHMSNLMPMEALALTWSASHLCARPRPRWATVAVTGAALWFGLGLAGVLGMPLLRVVQGGYVLSDLPRLNGALVPAGYVREMRAGAGALRAAAGGESLLLLVANAGAHYLVSGLRNPTPFDYPLASAFGANGQSRVVAMLEKGRLTSVCLDRASLAAQEPAELVAYVTGHLTEQERAGPCSMYRR